MDEGRKEGQALLERRREERRKMNWQRLTEEECAKSVTETLTFLHDCACTLCGELTIAPEKAQRPLCPSCKNAQLLEQERNDTAKEKLLRAGLLDGELAHMTMEDFVQETEVQRRAYEVVRLWWNDWMAQIRLAPSKGYWDSVYLWSVKPGTGKTHLARAVQQKAILIGRYPKFQPVSQLINKLRASYDSEELSSDRIMRELFGCDLLLLDDLGKEYVSGKSQGWFKDLLWNVIAKLAPYS
jgi:chromosomal replication initiation ATPase DnaA